MGVIAMQRAVAGLVDGQGDSIGIEDRSEGPQIDQDGLEQKEACAQWSACGIIDGADQTTGWLLHAQTSMNAAIPHHNQA
jgi:hypothetical protein